MFLGGRNLIESFESSSSSSSPSSSSLLEKPEIPIHNYPSFTRHHHVIPSNKKGSSFCLNFGIFCFQKKISKEPLLFLHPGVRGGAGRLLTWDNWDFMMGTFKKNIGSTGALTVEGIKLRSWIDPPPTTYASANSEGLAGEIPYY